MSLLDLYPTLIDVCGLPPREGLSGRSLAPLLKNPGLSSDRAVLTTFDQGNYSVMGLRWHYIRYADGNEELYDNVSDPNEWTNLAKDPNHTATLQEMAKLVPHPGAQNPGEGKKTVPEKKSKKAGAKK